MQKLKNKFTIVSGASTGIGQSIAIEFAKEGAFVALIGRNKEKLLKTKIFNIKKWRSIRNIYSRSF